MDCFRKHGKTRHLQTLKLRGHLETTIQVIAQHFSTSHLSSVINLPSFICLQPKVETRNKVSSTVKLLSWQFFALCSWCCWDWGKTSQNWGSFESQTRGCFSNDWRGRTWLENSCNFTGWSKSFPCQWHWWCWEAFPGMLFLMCLSLLLTIAKSWADTWNVFSCWLVCLFKCSVIGLIAHYYVGLDFGRVLRVFTLLT